jgi:hypothetical protein
VLKEVAIRGYEKVLKVAIGYEKRLRKVTKGYYRLPNGTKGCGQIATCVTG